MSVTGTVGASGADRPLRRDAERNRQLILQTAHRVFADRGLDVSLDEIAQQAGVGVGTVYRRFPTKEALVEALFEQRLQAVVEIGQQALTDPDPWRGLLTFFERVSDMLANDRGLREVTLGTRYGREHVSDLRESLQPIATELVAKAQADGRLRADLSATDLPLLSLMVAAVADYTHHAHPDAFRRYITIVIDGLSTGRADTTPLPFGPLTDDQVDQAMRTWHPPRR
ncbi:TetR/AcrR family transcriptional regulator [Actinoplanes subtropicus]|uniref:TetR/AcrR family transcriptional regulator n=1 Tax=Actinoplanes subtropicus TaxID=543632 RepID=UPI0004C30186|nr:TetR/AcrR family transcriptional regulator [Actinoplanes subtropicus]